MGMASRTSVPSPLGERDRQVRVHQQRPLAHAVDTGSLGRDAALAVVGDPQRELVVACVQVEPDLARVGVARDVRQALLGDPVAHQLDFGCQPIRLRRSVFDHADSGGSGELGAQCGQGAVQSEVLEGIGPQPARDAADLVKTGPHRLLGVCQLAANICGRAVDGSFQDQQRHRQRLTDLVVSSLAMRWRSFSCAVSADALALVRSVSSRSSIELNDEIR